MRYRHGSQYMRSFKLLPVASALVVAAPSASAALSLVAGGVGVYDSINDVTWTSDANLVATQASAYPGGASALVAAIIAAVPGGVIHDTPNIFDNAGPGSYRLSSSDFAIEASGQLTGQMNWWAAQAWVYYLNAIRYGNSTQWNLPTTVNNDLSIGYSNGAAGNPTVSSSQLAELFYGQLGGAASPTGQFITSLNGGSLQFTNLRSFYYWSGTQYAGNPDGSWDFGVGYGYQSPVGRNVMYYALAVSPGQLGPIYSPPPASPASADGPLPLWSYCALGVGLIGVARRRLSKMD